MVVPCPFLIFYDGLPPRSIVFLWYTVTVSRWGGGNNFFSMAKMSFVRWFDQLGIKDVPLVGGKNASLGEMYRKLVPKGVAVPNGFAITAEAYFYLLKKAGIRDDIRRILSDLNTKDLRNLQARGRAVRQAILGADIPPDLEVMIAASYRQLERQYGKNVDVAVRSSATAEDLPDASFAGQQETYLNIR